MDQGQLIAGKYRLQRVIGQGAMGEVWAATNELTRRSVALKVIPSPDPELRSRLLQEARSCGRLAHPSIVEVYDAGEADDGAPFLVMQLLSGETLAERLDRAGRLPTGAAVGIAIDVARALRTAHAAGIVHRDLKPANVFLHLEPGADREQVKVLDFGISKVLSGADGSRTATGTILGSPAYMSPEQARADKGVDHRADLWSLGVMLFEMLAGVRPFRGHTAHQVIAVVMTAPVPALQSVAPDVDEALCAAVGRCLERDRGRRVQSAEEVIRLLQSFMSPNERTRSGNDWTPMTTETAPHSTRLPVASPVEIDDDALATVALPRGRVPPMRPRSDAGGPIGALAAGTPLPSGVEANAAPGPAGAPLGDTLELEDIERAAARRQRLPILIVLVLIAAVLLLLMIAALGGQ